MTEQEIKDNAPCGATHYDDQDFWKLQNGEWFIWLDSCGRWRRIYAYQKFHDSLPIKPL